MRQRLCTHVLHSHTHVTRPHTHSRTHARTHTRTHARMLPRSTHARARKQSRTHARTHAHITCTCTRPVRTNERAHARSPIESVRVDSHTVGQTDRQTRLRRVVHCSAWLHCIL
jgi:hypothetical protein